MLRDGSGQWVVMWSRGGYKELVDDRHNRLNYRFRPNRTSVKREATVLEKYFNSNILREWRTRRRWAGGGGQKKSDPASTY